MKNASVNQRIPHLLKAKPGEVFFIGGGEAGDAVVAEGEGETDVVDAAGGIAGAGVLPDLVHETGAGIVEGEPGGILAQVFDFPHGFFRGERLGTDHGVSQEGINLDQHQFAEGEGLVGDFGFQKSAGRRVVRVGCLQGREENIGVADGHARKVGGLAWMEEGGGAGTEVGGLAPIGIGEGVAQDLRIGRWLQAPRGADLNRKRPGGEEQFGSAAQGFGEGPLLFLGQPFEALVEFVRNLDLRFRHNVDELLHQISGGVARGQISNDCWTR